MVPNAKVHHFSYYPKNRIKVFPTVFDFPWTRNTPTHCTQSNTLGTLLPHNLSWSTHANGVRKLSLSPLEHVSAPHKGHPKVCYRLHDPSWFASRKFSYLDEKTFYSSKDPQKTPLDAAAYVVQYSTASSQADTVAAQGTQKAITDWMHPRHQDNSLLSVDSLIYLAELRSVLLCDS